MALALAGLVVPGAWADDGNVERRVHRPHIVTPLATGSPTGLSPAQVKAAYNFPTGLNGGAGRTVAVVAPFDAPTIEKDLNTFSRKFGLPGCTTANGCFRKVDQRGGTHYPAKNKLWALEIALDVEWLHAIAPGADILLVEARSDRLSDVLVAEDYATAHARYVTNSLGIDEFAGESGDDSHFHRPGVSIFAASGDDGAANGPGYPAASNQVTAVGGTTLTLNADGTRASETAWAGAGSGCSAIESKPSWQKDTGCARRAVADVSAVADPATGLAVYDTTRYQGQKGWFAVGGTSASSPMWAARAAVSGRVIDARLLYAASSPIAFRDVTAGNNGRPALPGFDLVTGLGSWTGPTP